MERPRRHVVVMLEGGASRNDATGATAGARDQGVTWSLGGAASATPTLGAQGERHQPDGDQQRRPRRVLIDERDNQEPARAERDNSANNRKLTSSSLELELQRLKMHEKLLLRGQQKLIDELRGGGPKAVAGDSLGSGVEQQPPPLQQHAVQMGPPAAEANAAVECRNLNYLTGLGAFRRHILHNLTLTVPEGSIYGLLGPSGCGKTTLLRCVAGRLEPAAGSHLRVFGFRPNEPASGIPGRAIGYMPQETSVYEEFTIDETLTYFGRINGMRARLLEARVDFLLKFLHLPAKQRLIKSLSGGQKRRVSLAVALVHAPPLLILDEPTVGVDPLLRQSIWSYLAALASSERATIIITTHYIEEARQAHVVGLMRRGRLLAESDPHELMRAAGLATLESVFLKLCVTSGPLRSRANSSASGERHTFELELGGATATVGGAAESRRISATSDLAAASASSTWSDGDEDEDEGEEEVGTKRGSSSGGNKEQLLEAREFISAGPKCRPMEGRVERGAAAGQPPGWASWLRVLLAVTWKNYLRLRRNPPVLVFEFLLPALQVILFCLCIGGPPIGIQLAVVNEEQPPQASGLFLNSLEPTTFERVAYANLSEALEAVRRGRAWAAVHVPRAYSRHLNERLLHPAEVSNETLANATISIYPDLTNLHLALAIEGAFKEAFVRFSRDSLEILGYDRQLAELPIRMAQPIYGGAAASSSNQTSTSTSGYLEFMAPGVVISITYVMATGLTALAFILEKRDGLLERSQISGVTTGQILLAHSLLQVLVMALQIGLVLLVTFHLFRVPFLGSFALVALLVLLQGCTGMAFGLLISAVCREENAAIMMLVGTFYINLILAGIMWPLEAMPRWLRPLSYAQPQTLPIIGLRDIMARGWSLDEPSVQLAFLVTLFWLHAFLLSAGLCMRYIK